jgi:hypothetical protein
MSIMLYKVLTHILRIIKKTKKQARKKGSESPSIIYYFIIKVIDAGVLYVFESQLVLLTT